MTRKLGYSHGRVSTRVWLSDRKEAPARAFSQDEVRIAHDFEEDLLVRGRRRSYCCVSEGVGFTEQPRVEVQVFTTLDRVSVCLAKAGPVVDWGARTRI